MIGLYSMFMLWKIKNITSQCSRPWCWHLLGDEFVECVLSSPLLESSNVSKSMKWNPWESLFEKKVLGEKVQIQLASWTLEASSKTLNLVALEEYHWYQYSFLQGRIYWKFVAKYNPLPKNFNITKLKNKTLTFDPTHWLLQNEKLFKCLQLGQSLGHPININIFSPSPFEVHPIFCICWAFPPQQVISMDTLCWMKNSLPIVWTWVWVYVNMIRMQWPPWGLIKGK